MACKTFLEWLLKVLNFLLVLVGLAMIGYGVYLFVEYKTDASTVNDSTDASSSTELVQLGRPMLAVVSVAESIFEKLPKAWYDEQLSFKLVSFFFFVLCHHARVVFCEKVCSVRLMANLCSMVS